MEYGLKSKISECRIQSLCYHALLCRFKSKGILKEIMSLKQNCQWYIESLGIERQRCRSYTVILEIKTYSVSDCNLSLGFQLVRQNNGENIKCLFLISSGFSILMGSEQIKHKRSIHDHLCNVTEQFTRYLPNLKLSEKGIP